MARFIAEFGLTPASRTRIAAPHPEEPDGEEAARKQFRF